MSNHSKGSDCGFGKYKENNCLIILKCRDLLNLRRVCKCGYLKNKYLKEPAEVFWKNHQTNNNIISPYWEYALEAIIKWFIDIFMFMINVYYPCYNCINRKHNTYVWNMNNQVSLVSLYWTSSLVKRWLRFPNHRTCYSHLIRNK